MGQNGRAGSGQRTGYRPGAPARCTLHPARSSVPARCTLYAAPSSVLRRDHRAVGGFFEEIPAFVVVVLSVSMFLVAAYSTYGRMGDDGELSSLQDGCRRLCRAFRCLPAVLEDGEGSGEPKNGVFGAGKLDALEHSELQRALNSPHPYNLTVRDLATGRSWSFGRALPAGAALKVRVPSAAVVADEEGRHDPARLEVVMWR